MTALLERNGVNGIVCARRADWIMVRRRKRNKNRVNSSRKKKKCFVGDVAAQKYSLIRQPHHKTYIIEI